MATTSATQLKSSRSKRSGGVLPSLPVGAETKPLRRPSASSKNKAALEETDALLEEIKKQQALQIPPQPPAQVVNTAVRVPIDFSLVLENSASTARDLLGPLNAITSVLDEVTKLHPFVSIAVAPFKVVINFYMEGLQNDKKIAILINRMADMMCAFEPLCSAQGARLKTGHLKSNLLQIEKDISECGKAIDLYFKQKTIIRFIKSPSWQEKLEDFIDTFADHKQQLMTLLAVSIQSTTQQSQATIIALDRKMEAILDIVRHVSRSEQEIHNYLQKVGGLDRCLVDEGLLTELILTSEGVSLSKPKTRFNEPGPMQPIYNAPYGRQMPFNSSPYGELGQNRSPRTPNHSRHSSHNDRRHPSDEHRAHTLTRRTKSRSPPRGPAIYSQNGAESQQANDPHRGHGWRYKLRSRSQDRDHDYRAQGWPSNGYNGGGYSRTPYHDDGLESSTGPKIIPAHESQEWLMQTKVEVRSAATTDLQIMLQQNNALWNLKFEHQTRSLQRTVELNTSRVLAVLQSGPHERLREPHMREIWQAEKWRGSVAGPVFLQAVQDYYWTRFEDLTLRTGRVPQVAWTVNFLGTPYRGALLEVIDIDQSGFVSIPETARFTDMKPRGWSLPVWFAYMSVRWSFEAAYYKTTLTTVFELMDETLRHLQFSNPNREQVSKYIGDVTAWIRESVVDPLNVPLRRYDDARKNDVLIDLLKRGMKERESHIQRKLQQVRWEIDGAAALAAIAGDGPVEQWLLPLLHVLLQQHQRIIDMALKYTLDPRELGSAWGSITQILQVLNTRVLYLLDCVQPRLVKDLFTEFACGMFSNWPWERFPTPVLKEAEPEPPSITNVDGGPESRHSASEITADILRYPAVPKLEEAAQPYPLQSIMKQPGAHGDDDSLESRHLENGPYLGEEPKGFGGILKSLFGRKKDPNKEYVDQLIQQQEIEAEENVHLQ